MQFDEEVMRTRRARRNSQVVSGQVRSFAHLYDLHVDEVYRYVHRRCQDHGLTEDIVQETFIAAIGRADDPNEITVAWLIGVSRNKLFDVFRRQMVYDKKLKLLANSELPAGELDLAERLLVEAALRELPTHYRLVLTLHHMNGMTVPAIAKELDQSVKSVESLVARARKKFTLALEQQDHPHTERGHYS